LERSTIHAKEREGICLRNIDLVGLPQISPALDLVVDHALTDEWLLGTDAGLVLGPREQFPPTTRMRQQHAQLRERGDYEVIVDGIATYLERVVPWPHRTECRFWSLTAMPSTNRSQNHRRLFALSINNVEVLVAFEERARPGGAWRQIWFMNVSSGVRLPLRVKLFARQRNFYVTAGTVRQIYADGPIELSPAVVSAARKLAIKLLRKGQGLFARFHNQLLADDVFAVLERRCAQSDSRPSGAAGPVRLDAEHKEVPPMSFDDALEDLAARVAEYADSIQTEEATKTAIIMPFIGRVLGYDVFNPAEVVPEFVADVGIKKGEKIDYAIVRDGQVQILVEAKKIGESLKRDHASQLTRYFAVSKARIGALTNGRTWEFYTDLDRPNVMDEAPFLRLDLLAIDPHVVPELKKLAKDSFDLDSVLASAEELKYVSAFKSALGEIFASPTDDFVRLLVSRVYQGRVSPALRETFAKLVTRACAQFVSDRVNERLKLALRGEAPSDIAVAEVEAESKELQDEIETTLDELEGFAIVRAIVVSDVAYERVVDRDAKSYFAILLDDNNRKPICRLHFNRAQKYLGLFDADKKETRVPLGAASDIYLHADALRETVRRYL
jgi:hypothetical protein